MSPVFQPHFRLWLIALLAWQSVVELASGQVVFSDVTTTAGITYSLPSSQPRRSGYAVSRTGGAAARDYDNDGWPDLFVTRYWDSPVLYRNNHDGTFIDVTATAFPGGLEVPSSNGAAWSDIDNDGDADLYVTTLNR